MEEKDWYPTRVALLRKTQRAPVSEVNLVTTCPEISAFPCRLDYSHAGSIVLPHEPDRNGRCS